MGISIVLLAYNEEKNLRILLPQIISNVNKLKENYEILIVDSEKATDHTKEVCKEYGCIYKNQEEAGFGGAFRTGIKYASMDKFLIMDSDGSHPPNRIPAIYNKFKSEDYDVVIGSRYVVGGCTNDTAISKIMSYILNFAYRLAIGINAKDLSTNYRMYHTNELKSISLDCKNYDVLEEVLLKLKINKSDRILKVGEVPISFEKRMYGKSKRKLVRFIISYIKTIFRLLKLRVVSYHVFIHTTKKCNK